MFKLFMLINFILPLIEDIVALCFPQLDRKGLMYDPFGGRYVNVHEVFKLCAILKTAFSSSPRWKCKFSSKRKSSHLHSSFRCVIFEENFYGIDGSIFDIGRYTVKFQIEDALLLNFSNFGARFYSKISKFYVVKFL